MATTGVTNLGEVQITQESTDRLKLLYPAVNEEDTPIPRSWSPKDKFNFIGLSKNNLRAHYKGRPLALSRTRTMTVFYFINRMLLFAFMRETGQYLVIL